MNTYRSFLLVPLVAATMALSAVSAAAVPTDSDQIPADSAAHNVLGIGLSYDGQHAAWIMKNATGTRLILASPSGRNPHAVTIPGHCHATELRWARKWNRLAVMTACPSGHSDNSSSVHSAIWVVNVQANRPPHKITTFPGAAHDMQWTSDDKKLVFLYVPDATTMPISILLGAKGSDGQRIASISIAGDGNLPDRITPGDLNVWEFRLSPSRNRVAYTATKNNQKRQDAGLYVQTTEAAKKPEMVLNPTRENSVLQGMHIALPRWAPESNALFFLAVKNVPGAVGGNIYLLPGARKGTPVNLTHLTAGAGAIPTWFKYVYVGQPMLLVNQRHGNQSQIAAYYLYSNHASLRNRFFSVSGMIGNGQTPNAICVVPRQAIGPSRTFRIAFLQASAGNTLIARIGPLTTSIPPIVAKSGIPDPTR